MLIHKRRLGQGVIFWVLCFQVLAITAQDHPILTEVWMVTEGDHQTYFFKKIYDYTQDPPNQIRVEYTSPSGEMSLLIYKQGMKITYTITTIDQDEVLANMQLNQSCIVEINPPVTKTIADRTYWENEYADSNTTKISNDLIISETTESFGGYTTRSIYKWNWKTGWMEYLYFSGQNDTTLFVEYEIENITTTSIFPPNFVYGVGILAGIGGILGIRMLRSHKKR